MNFRLLSLPFTLRITFSCCPSSGTTSNIFRKSSFSYHDQLLSRCLSYHHQVREPRLPRPPPGPTVLQYRSSSSSVIMPTPAALHIQPANPTWREAASLIILAQNHDHRNLHSTNASSPSPPKKSDPNFDYSILMVKRSGGSSFMASAFVFPGGQVELSDFDLKWYQLFDKLGMKREELDRSVTGEIVGPRPPIIHSSITLKSQEKLLNPDVALRISAIRETFEEAGILLLTSTHQRNNTSASTAVALTPEELTDWQLRVRNDASAFYELCDTFRLVPNIWSLYEWSDWLTPVSVGHRRFDTIFYVCCLGRQPEVQVDNAEVTKPIWCSPTSILEEHRTESVFLAPPQVYELSRMLHFPVMDRFHRFLRARQVLGTERWLPVMLTFDDGAISVLPGDDRYPSEPQLVTSAPVAELDGSVEDANRDSAFKNRIELRGIQSRALCTVEPGCGHMAPITFDEEYSRGDGNEKDLKSKL